MDDGRAVGSIEEFINAVEDDYRAWNTESHPWFRGEPGGVGTPLVPKLYRPKTDGTFHDENALLQFFRKKAPFRGLPYTPRREDIDLWLFLARHMGLPTRLLDWTDGALIALHFALAHDEPVVWMLNPLRLTRLNLPEFEGELKPNAPTITWTGGAGNLHYRNVKGAWEEARFGTQLPVPIYPTNVHPLMSAQHSCFTISGYRQESLAEMVGEDCLRRYKIRVDRAVGLAKLRRLGISESTLFPDARGLAKELEHLY